jgi:hypothetical protein
MYINDALTWSAEQILFKLHFGLFGLFLMPTGAHGVDAE